MLENVGKTGRKKSLTEAAIGEGYSPKYAKSGRLTSTKSWAELMEDFLPDDVLLEGHRELHDKIEIQKFIFPKGVSDKKIIEIIESFGFRVMKIDKYENWKRAYYPILETNARRSALDMAYKLKKKYGDIIVTHKYDELSDEELEAAITKVGTKIFELRRSRQRARSARPRVQGVSSNTKKKKR